MAKGFKLLLTENVEALGIVGDVVNVRAGYARNFLLPRDLATQPSEEKIKALASKRAAAEKMLAELRRQREELVKKLEGVEVELIRSCNDQGVLYGAITQQDIASALNAKGYAVKPRDVRLNFVMKRIESHDVHVKLDADLDATVKVHVKPDRKLDLEKAREEHPPEAGAETAVGAADGRPEARADSKPDAKPESKVRKDDKPAKKKDAGDAKDAAPAAAPADKAEKSDKGEKKAKGKKDAAKEDAKAAPKDTKGTFAKPDTNQQFDFGLKRPRRKDRE